MGNQDDRIKICQMLGARNLLEVHKIITQGARKSSGWLLGKGITSWKLKTLGYDVKGLKKLGYKDDVLSALGYILPSKAPQAKKTEAMEMDKSEADKVRELVAKGYDANELRQRGITVHHLRMAGIDARELFRRGFRLDELRGEFTLSDLKMIGLNPRELIVFFPGSQLRKVGFTAQEMRCAGFSVRDLLNFGYNENQVIGAGYSIRDLLNEGLSPHTHEPLNY